jgi:hypothetical protein
MSQQTANCWGQNNPVAPPNARMSSSETAPQQVDGQVVTQTPITADAGEAGVGADGAARFRRPDYPE